MSQSSFSREYDIQASDTTDVPTTVENLVAKKRRRLRSQETLDVEATVRELLSEAQDLLVTDHRSASYVLGVLHTTLERDPQFVDLVTTGGTELDDHLDIDRRTAIQYRRLIQRAREIRREHSRALDPEKEYTALQMVAQAFDYAHSPRDMTHYADVTMEQVQKAGTATASNPIPIGRRRLKTGTRQSTDEAAVEIPHESCDHILTVAIPRRGKDSTIASIGMNLWRQHGYKYISIFDDGRMETPMLAVPNDDQDIRDNLERLDQQPQAFDAEVFVPAITEGMPDLLPSNFTPFTIGIESLTPELILRLANVRTNDETAEDRIQMALEETLAGSGGVPELVAKLQQKAEEAHHVISWREEVEADDGTVEREQEAHYEVPQSKALERAASRLSKLAGDGLITSANATTNIDMREVVQDRSKAAVLCCTFLPNSHEGVKFTVIDLWLRLIFNIRDRFPRLPRVAIEIRELKNLAPTNRVMGSQHRDIRKTLRDTIFQISTQGGSRRVMMLGSTQKFNDVVKSVRTNMATKILLQLGEEEIEALDNAYHFSEEQKRQLSEFGTGKGMLIAGGEQYWPIEWRGAPCGLGLGDQHWLDRYGTTRGCRVRLDRFDGWAYKHGDEDWWVHVPEAAVRETDDPPAVGDFYSEWHLLASDFPDDTDREDVDEELIERVLAERREYEYPSDLSLEPVEVVDKDRSVRTYESGAESRITIESVMDRYDVPEALRPWITAESGQERKPETREKGKQVIRAVQRHEDEGLTSQPDIAQYLPFGRSSLANYMGDGSLLGECIEKNDDGEYHVTEMGERALEIPWDDVMDRLR